MNQELNQTIIGLPLPLGFSLACSRISCETGSDVTSAHGSENQSHLIRICMK